MGRSPNSCRKSQRCRSDPNHAGTPKLQANGQRRRVPVQLPLALGGAGYPACLHSTQNTSPERQGRALTSSRRAGVLPAARMGGLLQLPPAPWSPRRANPLRAAPGKENVGQRVTEVLRPYKGSLRAFGQTQLWNIPRNFLCHALTLKHLRQPHDCWRRSFEEVQKATEGHPAGILCRGSGSCLAPRG